MSQDGLQVENYLAQLRQRGELDSEGHFTVAGLRAVGKMALFLLANESDWVLKIVQGACQAQCPELHIKQTRTSTHFVFRIPATIDFDEFEKALVSTTQSIGQPGLDDIAVGLRAVGMGQQRDWVIKAIAGRQVGMISCTDGMVSAERFELTGEEALASSTDTTEVTIGVGYPRGQAGKLGGLIRFGEAIQNEHLTLLLKGRACPIPLYLDGRRIDDLSVSALATALETRAFLGINLPPADREAGIAVPSGIQSAPSFQLQDRFCSSDPYCVSALPTSGRARSLQRWYFNYTTSKETHISKGFYFQDVPTPSKICLVRRGVVVAQRNIGVTHPISVDVFLSADHLRSDLTGLQVRPTEEEIALAKDEIRSSLSFLDDLFLQLKTHSPRPMKHQLLMYGGLGALGLLVPTLAAKAAVGTVSTVLMARAAHQHQQIVDDCIKHLESFRRGVEAS